MCALRAGQQTKQKALSGERFPAENQDTSFSTLASRPRSFVPVSSAKLLVLEDNQSTLIVAEKGSSKQLKHVRRTHRVNMA